MLPASGGNLSGGCNSAGSTTYDLISSGILLEHNFLKVHFIGWSPNANGSDHWAAEDELSQALLSLMTLLFETDILKLEFYVGYFQF